MAVSNRGPLVVSFSGIDGAGKSTQIALTQHYLQEAKLRFRTLAFWDDVARLGSWRDRLCQKLFRGERGVGAPGKPIRRRDKNVSAWYLTAARFCLYLIDAVGLLLVVARLSGTDTDVVLFDRYLYDELANLPMRNPVVRAYLAFLLKCIPKPDVALLLDAEPLQAMNRKPEYPLNFLKQNRENYLALARTAGMVAIPPLPPNEVFCQVAQALAESLSPQCSMRFLCALTGEALATNN